ncbi:MAG: WYL domain-containing protein [Deltaproteobacteria bacterium]|nr:WYL domain-containing protein [Deltaproteobacteria bacterium]
MDRAERLLDLITLFLARREPIAFRELRDHFEDYSKVALDSALRKFERDKAELLELGLPLRYHEPSEADDEGGYLLSREEYFLPELELTPVELSFLSVAGAAAQDMEGFPWKAQVTRALEKIGFATTGTGAESPLSGRLAVHSRPRGEPGRVGQAFALLQDAIARRKRVSFTYHALYRDEVRQREVEPHGLYCRDGAWTLRAHCLLRREPRSFLLDRMEALSVNDAKPKSPDFEAPAALDLARLARERAWSWGEGEPETVRVALERRQAPRARRLFGEEARLTPAADGAVEVELEARFLEPLIEQLLSLRDAVAVIEPESLRAELRARLEALT